MIQTNFMEEIDCGNFFDHIDDLLEFPNDDVEISLLAGKSCSGAGVIRYDAFPPLWTGNDLQTDLPRSEPAFSNANSASDLSAELSVPYEDIVQLEWLSTFVEDSFSGGGLTVDNYNTSSSPKDSSAHHQTNQFQTSSPISVLESSSASSNHINRGKTIPVTHEKRARSKRPRPATFTPRPSIQLMAPHSESESVVESRSLLKKGDIKSIPVRGGEPQKKKKKIKFLPPSAGGPSIGTASQYENKNQNQTLNQNAGSADATTPSHPVRKCLHCEITKTPQWRAGPMGPKTLCNACGVRYKSGRLYPEYRPAASPTFVPSLHSNSHKKVLEMRTKTTEEEDSIITPKTEALISPESELLPAVM